MIIFLDAFLRVALFALHIIFATLEKAQVSVIAIQIEIKLALIYTVVQRVSIII